MQKFALFACLALRLTTTYYQEYKKLENQLHLVPNSLSNSEPFLRTAPLHYGSYTYTDF